MEKLASEVQVGEVIQALDRNFRVERIEDGDGFISFFGSSLWREKDRFTVFPTRVIPIIEGNSDLENAKESARNYFNSFRSN
jgi:hypothetical protein